MYLRPIRMEYILIRVPQYVVVESYLTPNPHKFLKNEKKFGLTNTNFS